MRVPRSLLTTSVAAALLAAGAVAAVPAAAASTVVVDDDGFATAGNCNAAIVTLNTSIQQGVDAAAAGDTVKVCPGTFVENVTVDKSITLLGARAGVDGRNRIGSTTESTVDPEDPDDPTASAPATFDITADNVTLDGFLLVGNENSPAIFTSATGSGYQVLNNRVTANALGLYLNASGATATVVQRNNFSANNENLGVAPAAGNGIYSDQGLKNAFIQANRFRNNINAAVIVAAGPADGVTASGNNSGADGVFFAAYIGSNYRITNNVVIASSGSGIFFGAFSGPLSGVTIQQNTVLQSSFSGIRISSAVSAVTVVANTSNGNGDQGISVSSAVEGAATVRNNTTNSNNGDGILFSAETNGNAVQFNRASGNGNLDCEDQSIGQGTAGTANKWTANIGTKRTPTGICAPRRR